MRRLLPFVLSCSMLCNAAEPSSFFGAADCRIVGPDQKKGESATWSGACVDGYASGSGVVKWIRDGVPNRTYEGNLERGVPKGAGILTYGEGSSLAGNFSGNGYDSAHVERRYSSGNRYTGAWADGPSGQGTMMLALGGSYEGSWKNGRFDGAGIITYPDGRRRNVQYKDGISVGSANIAAAEGEYTAKGHIGQLAMFATPKVLSIPVPPEKSYEELTSEQQQRIKSVYTILQDDDEPPYPLGGTKTMYLLMSKVQEVAPTEAILNMMAIVDKNGNGVEVMILKSPSPEMSRYAVMVLMQQKYKPAKCAGQPCAMAFPLRINFTLED